MAGVIVILVVYVLQMKISGYEAIITRVDVVVCVCMFTFNITNMCSFTEIQFHVRAHDCIDNDFEDIVPATTCEIGTR